MEILSEILGLLGGASVVITGLIAYFGKTRLEVFKSNLAATNNKINAFIDRSTHVSKEQFNKEFGVYQEIWESMIPLQNSTMFLRPMLDHVDPNQPENEIIKEKLKQFSNEYIAYRNLIEKNKPFYAKSVYEELYKILRLCHSEATGYKSVDGSNLEVYWSAQLKNHEEISAAIDEGCEAIRDRIESLSVIPN